MEPYQWKLLNKQQVGAYCEYFVKMEMTMYGFQVYTTEVDDRGVDFVCRHISGEFFQIQVKSIRTMGNVFLLKSKFQLQKSLYLALGLLTDGRPPELYLIPSLAWRDNPNELFGHNDYGEGYKSFPEWRLNISKKNLSLLQPYEFSRAIKDMIDDHF